MEGLAYDLFIYVAQGLSLVATGVIGTITFITFYKPIKRFVKMFKTHMIDWFFFLFTSTWLILVSQPFGCIVLWRWSVRLYIRLRYGPLGSLSTGADSAGSLDYPESRQIVKSLKILRGTPDLPQFRKRVEATASRKDAKGRLLYPKFHQYLDFFCGFYVWKPAQTFDINHHVRYAEGLNADSPSLSEDEMLALVSNYSNRAFAPKRGMWEILLIPRFHYKWEEALPPEERTPKFVILNRISHGIGDGFSFLKLTMREMADDMEKEDFTPPHKPVQRSWLTRIAIFFYLIFKSPKSFYAQIPWKDVNPLHHPKIKLTGEKVHVWSEPVNLDWMKELKTKLGCGMNSVFLSTLSSACRKYMMVKYGMSEADLPRKMRAIIPVPAPNHPNDTLANKFSIIMLPLELRKSRSFERCKEIEKESRAMAKTPYMYVNLFLMDLLAVYPVSFTRAMMVNSRCTAVISNLPGPRKEISIWGYKMEETMFWLPNVGTSGISVSYMSYGKKVRFALAVDTGVIKSGKTGAKELLSYMLEDLKTLAASVQLRNDDASIFLTMGERVESKEKLPLLPTLSLPPESKIEGHHRVGSEVGSEDYGYGGELSVSDTSFSSNESEEDLDEAIERCSKLMEKVEESQSQRNKPEPDANNNDNSNVHRKGQSKSKGKGNKALSISLKKRDAGEAEKDEGMRKRHFVSASLC